MAEFTPKLVADAAGVWREENAGKRYGIGWNEVYAVSGYKLDGATAIYTVIVLDFSYGHFLELSSASPGFEQVLQAITERLSGISPDWFAQVEQLGVEDAPLLVWQRV